MHFFFSETSVFGQPPLFITVYWCLLIFVQGLMMVLGLFVMQFECFLPFCLHFRPSFASVTPPPPKII